MAFARYRSRFCNVRSAVRFADSLDKISTCDLSDESVGYFQSSAAN